MNRLTSIEICAGGGGQARGLEKAGFEHVALVENDHACCATLRQNRPHWNVLELDVHAFAKKFGKDDFPEIDLLAGGVPCPPFSMAGKKLGADDERDLFPAMLNLVETFNPKAVMIENVRGLLEKRFDGYRGQVDLRLRNLGFEEPRWLLLQADWFGVPQLRPRVVCVALKEPYAQYFAEPTRKKKAPTVGEALRVLMAANGWEGADDWAKGACEIAPTLVGGSKKHGGPDLGPTRARAAWAKLGVDGGTLAPDAPEQGFKGQPRLTVQMAAVVQGFEPEWAFWGGKTAAYRQVGNAFPPPVAHAVAASIKRAIRTGARLSEAEAAQSRECA